MDDKKSNDDKYETQKILLVYKAKLNKDNYINWIYNKFNDINKIKYLKFFL